MPLVAVVAVGVGLLGMWKVHQFSEPEPVITVNGPQAPDEFNLKRITYEVFGSVGDGGKLVYVDIDGHPHQVDVTTLPWSHHARPPRSQWRPAASRCTFRAARWAAGCWWMA